jgi:hypothetical protein
MVVPGVETLGLRLHQCHLMQVEVLFSFVELDLLLPQHLAKAEGMLGACGVHLHLAEVLFSISLGLCLLGVKVSADLDQGFLGNFDLLLPCGEGLLPLHQLLLLR